MPLSLLKHSVLSGFILALIACGGGGSSSDDGSDSDSNDLINPPIGDNIIPQTDEKPETELEAARFLQRATFGATEESVAELMNMGYSRWIDKQLNMPYVKKIMDKHPVSGVLRNRGLAEIPEFEMGPYQTLYLQDIGKPSSERSLIQLNQIWLYKAINDPDQLKQRIAFALSQIMVASGVEKLQADAGMRYLDLMLKNSNGHFRQLLEDVTLNPLMGNFLDMAGNAKAGTKKNSVADENYAREVLQLFSLGLYELNMDGTRKQNSDGNFIDTYQQSDVEEYARAFTGWSYQSSFRGFFHKGKYADLYTTMKFFPGYHDTGTINLLGGKSIAGEDGSESLRITLDSIAEHQNVAPFISKQLIQKFVKSNPTPAYVERVARAFKRSDGNIGVTVKALLLDSENLRPSSTEEILKVKEPLLGYVQVLRATHAKPRSGKYAGRQEPSLNLRSQFAQAPVQAPSVFNFFKPEYAPASFTHCEGSRTPGTPDCPVAPELEVYDDIQYIRMMNTLQGKILHNNLPYNPKGNAQILRVDLRNLFNINAETRELRRDSLNKGIEIYILGHKMPKALKTQVDRLQASELVNNSTKNIVKETLALVVGSPQFWVQR